MSWNVLGERGELVQNVILWVENDIVDLTELIYALSERVWEITLSECKRAFWEEADLKAQLLLSTLDKKRFLEIWEYSKLLNSEVYKNLKEEFLFFYEGNKYIKYSNSIYYIEEEKKWWIFIGYCAKTEKNKIFRIKGSLLEVCYDNTCSFKLLDDNSISFTAWNHNTGSWIIDIISPMGVNKKWSIEEVENEAIVFNKDEKQYVIFKWLNLEVINNNSAWYVTYDNLTEEYIIFIDRWKEWIKEYISGIESFEKCEINWWSKLHFKDKERKWNLKGIERKWYFYMDKDGWINKFVVDDKEGMCYNPCGFDLRYVLWEIKQFWNSFYLEYKLWSLDFIAFFSPNEVIKWSLHCKESLKILCDDGRKFIYNTITSWNLWGKTYLFWVDDFTLYDINPVLNKGKNILTYTVTIQEKWVTKKKVRESYNITIV